jgi:hypothetical protein
MLRHARVLLPAHPLRPSTFGTKRSYPWLSFLRGECDVGIDDGELITPTYEELFDGALVEVLFDTSQRNQKSQLVKKSDCEDLVLRLVSSGQ